MSPLGCLLGVDGGWCCLPRLLALPPAACCRCCIAHRLLLMRMAPPTCRCTGPTPFVRPGSHHGCREQPDEEIEDVCPQNIALKWHAEAGSAVYATPLITDLFSDGKKDIVVPAFQHHLEVRRRLDGVLGKQSSCSRAAAGAGT